MDFGRKEEKGTQQATAPSAARGALDQSQASACLTETHSPKTGEKPPPPGGKAEFLGIKPVPFPEAGTAAGIGGWVDVRLKSTEVALVSQLLWELQELRLVKEELKSSGKDIRVHFEGDFKNRVAEAKSEFKCRTHNLLLKPRISELCAVVDKLEGKEASRAAGDSFAYDPDF